jgi:hypothetical protein
MRQNDDGDLIPILHKCWVCAKEFRTGEGHSIRDDEEEQVCTTCWLLIPPAQRIWITWALREFEQGGSGFQDFLEQAIASMAEMGWKRLLEKQGGSEN